MGNTLAKLIINPNINTSIHDTLEDKNKYSFFISPTTPSEIYNIIDNITSNILLSFYIYILYYSTDIFNMDNISFKYINEEIIYIRKLHSFIAFSYFNCSPHYRNW